MKVIFHMNIMDMIECTLILLCFIGCVIISVVRDFKNRKGDRK